ncbi:unnamed protein product [Trichogramma brassicae]|uniref:Uncharacterized protein n=1 Tax=Trichogramma brassicae TaxID=86971 RepID=A0A6H5IV37_9HYME|nr:unnamed protein product [Trichogramma brassicae]
MDWLLTKCEYHQDEIVSFVMKFGYEDELEIDEDGKPLLNRSTLVHYAGKYMWNDDLVRNYFKIYHRFDVNYIDEFGYTHFHAACQFGFDDIVQKFLELGQNPNIVAPKFIKSKKEKDEGEEEDDDDDDDEEEEPLYPPLHLALRWNRQKVVELLLTNGADPNLASAEGLTPLHAIVKRSYCDHNRDTVKKSLPELFLKFCDDKNMKLQVNARDERGDTPLHSALETGCSDCVEMLMRRGADPSSVNEEGSTPLHSICHLNGGDEDLLTMFLEINAELDQLVPDQINARNKLGNTPLHLAVEYRHNRLVESLLRNGADPNLANEEGSTPLHIICQRYNHRYTNDDNLTNLFFEVNRDIQKTVQIDARDKLGRTPLQWAVANFLLDTVDILLNQGADLSSFVFPAVSHFDEGLKWYPESIWSKLRLLSDTLDVVDRLEKREYKLDRRGAITIMNALVNRHKFFKKPADLDGHWHDNEKFVKKAKEMMITPNMSLYDLIQLRPGVAEKLFTFTEIYEFVNSIDNWHWFSRKDSDGCSTYLCEISSRRFFRRWALDSLVELTRHKLPILCCDTVIEQLPNEDLRRKEIDRLLMDSINYMDENAYRAQLFIEFVSRSGCKDPQSRVIGDIEPRHTTALHLAARSGWFPNKYAVIRELFRFYDKFDVNYTDEGGLTHFHVACKYGLAGVVEKFLESRQNPNYIDEVTRDSPLHMALAGNHKIVAQLLLRSDVDPNLANLKGSTSLHIICMKHVDDDLVEIFFQINDDEHRILLVNAVDNKGRTPLHYALHNNRKRLTELLLRRGANPNLADSEGQTPLHVACQAYDDNNLVQILFEICDELNQLVEVDVRDKFGRTPLQSAVANFLLDTVDLLLNHGADLSSFVFPTESYFGGNCELPWNHKESEFNFKLRQASGALAVVECLEKRGYVLDRSDALTVMKFFVKYELFEKSTDLDECRHECTCETESDDSSHDEGEGQDADFKNLPNLEKLKILKEKVNWEVKQDRMELLRKIYPIIKKWKTELPDLRDIFRKEQIDLLLSDSLYHEKGGWFSGFPGKRFIRFVLRTRYRDTPDLDENGKPSSRRSTAIHLAANDIVCYSEEAVGELFQIYQRFDVNYTNDAGFTHFHAACKAGLQNIVKRFLDAGVSPNCLVTETGDSGLHSALDSGQKHLMPLLLKYKANPNLINKEGFTPVHYTCMRGDDKDLVEMLVEHCDNQYKPVQVDVPDEKGLTPLYYAARTDYKNVIKYLLSKGANPNATDAKGLTPLHRVCKDYYRDEDMAQTIFKIHDEENEFKWMPEGEEEEEEKYDKLGRMKIVAELLLNYGANPNSTDVQGVTPLHFICQRYSDDDFVEAFFKINDEKHQTVDVDARDNLGWTPLQWAVANFLPHVVEVLLDHCTDLSSFDFPSEALLVEGSRPWRYHVHFKLRLATGALAVLKCLENRGYQLHRSDALAMMKLFSDSGLFKKSANLDEYWFDEEEFANEAKKIMIMISPRVSLYDLIRKQPEETTKLLKYSDYFNFKCSKKSWVVPKKYKQACAEHLCEKLMRGSCQQWTKEHFLKLTRNQLPIEICNKIIELLINEDLYNICLAANI